MISRLFAPILLGAALTACSAEETDKPTMETRIEKPAEPAGKVVKTDAEWKEELTPEQYRILREAGTERAHGEIYKEFMNQGEGSYHCAGCKVLLFTSNEKFDSGCGWPSFYDPAKAENVVLKKDTSGGMVRVEVVCARCDGHLGHVFEGEGFNTPTDQRYCINGGGLIFVPAGEEKPAVVEKKPAAE